MKRVDIEYIVAILLFFSVAVTGLLGYFQSQLELRKFVPHRYAAYTTLCLAALHVCLHAGKVWRYMRRIVKGK
jgi:hypothetical protein